MNIYLKIIIMIDLNYSNTICHNVTQNNSKKHPREKYCSLSVHGDTLKFGLLNQIL